MPDAIVVWGRRPAPAPPKNRATHEGGGDSFGVVYANNLARSVLNSEPPAQFPAGSIIVREKLIQKDDERPSMLTVMIKRKPGFNKTANDWEFLAVEGDGSKVIERQKKGSCLDCHVSQRERDFVYPQPPN